MRMSWADGRLPGLQGNVKRYGSIFVSMNENNDKLPGPVSRRDFLRRAGKEAVTTGTRLVPGAKLATAALGATPGQEGWWQRLAKWRQGQNPESKAAETPAVENPDEQ